MHTFIYIYTRLNHVTTVLVFARSISYTVYTPTCTRVHTTWSHKYAHVCVHPLLFCQDFRLCAKMSDIVPSICISSGTSSKSGRLVQGGKRVYIGLTARYCTVDVCVYIYICMYIFPAYIHTYRHTSTSTSTCACTCTFTYAFACIDT